ncbi:TonB-dependent receptor [Saprospiraceae bacterium]|nr:TonB-dependent receptor [Saprospiraceae bacterium]
MKYQITIFLSIVFMLSATAQQDTIAYNFEQLVIKENRIELPFSDNSRTISILTRQDIQELNYNSINEVLQNVGGVDVRQRGVHGVQSDISIRGGTFEQTLILINGIKMIDPQTGHHMMNLPISVDDIERIEVIKGPGARIYGQNAYAGAINIVTKSPGNSGANMRVEYGQNETYNVNASVTLPMGNYNQRVSGNYMQSDGYRFNTDYEISTIFYQSTLDIGEGALNFYFGNVDRKFGANGFYGSETFTDQYEEVQTTIGTVELEKSVVDWKTTSRFNWRRNQDNWQFRREDPDFFQNFHTTNVYNGETHWSRGHNLGIFGVGVDVSYLDLESSNLRDAEGNGSHTRTISNVHIENRFLFANENLDITPGVLVSYVSDIGTDVFPGLDVGYRINSDFKVYSNIGWTMRVPSFTELFYQDAGNAGNSDLTEERAFTSEVGVKYQKNDIILQTSIFNRAAKDQIDWSRVLIDSTEKWMPSNFNSADYRGVDVSIRKIFDSKSPLKHVNLTYTYIDAEFSQTSFAVSRNQLENLRHQVNFNTLFSYSNINLGVNVRYNDRVSLENYTVVDTRLSYNLSSMTFYLKANNLLDTEYRETNLVPMPGRWVLGGARFRF